MRAMNHRSAVFVLLAILVCGCSDSPTPAASQSESTPIDPATVGNVSVQVTYSGEVPAPKPIVMSSAPQCALAHDTPVYDQSLLVTDGRVQNAIVYIDKGLEKFAFAPPAEPIVVDQIRCLYVPRVSVVMVGQPVEFLNSDAEAHNVHGFPEALSSWNFMLSRKGAKRTMTFDRPEMGVRVGCDIHPWMRGYLGVTTHPFAVVTPANGQVSLTGIPAGTYTLSVWHETLGTTSKEIEIAAGGTTSAELVYAPSARDG